MKLVEDGGLDGYDNAGLVGFLRSFEQLRNRLPLIDHRAIRDARSPLPARRVDPVLDDAVTHLGATAVAR